MDLSMNRKQDLQPILKASVRGLKVAYKIMRITLKLLKKFSLIVLENVLDFLLTLIAGCVLAIRDLLRQKAARKRSVRKNIINFIVNAVTLTVSIWFLTYGLTAVATATARPLGLDKQMSSVKAHINSMSALNQDRLPNTSAMPAGVHYVEMKPLVDSPLVKGEITSAQYQNGKLRVVNKLFTDPKTDDQKYLNHVVQGAQVAALSYGVNPSVLIAQSYIESAGGQSELAAKYNNYFGIKYRGHGKSINMPTEESDPLGNRHQENADFQVYSDLADSMADNARLIRNGIKGQNNRYAGAWVENTKSYKDATKALTGTYATDTDYNKTLNKFIETYNLNVLDNH